jgi:hypothetical protein
MEYLDGIGQDIGQRINAINADLKARIKKCFQFSM